MQAHRVAAVSFGVKRVDTDITLTLPGGGTVDSRQTRKTLTDANGQILRKEF
jgi:hypothetical protein